MYTRGIALGLAIWYAPAVFAEPPLLEVSHKSPVRCITYSADGKLLVSGSEDGAIRLTNATTGKVLRTMQTGLPVLGVTFSKDGKLLGISNKGGKLSIWDAATGKMRKTFSFGGVAASQYETPLIAFAKNDQEVIGVGVGQKIVWRHAQGGASGSRSHNPPKDSQAAVAADGSVLAWTWSDSVRFYEVNQRRYSYLYQMKDIISLAFTADGTYLAMGKQDATIRLFEVATRKEIAKLAGVDSRASMLAFSRDGKMLAACGADDFTLCLWDIQGKRLRRRLRIHQKDVSAVAVSPDGRSVATGGAKSVFVWNVATRDLGELGPPIQLSDNEMEKLWLNLYAGSSKIALDTSEDAFRKLAQGRKAALPFLQRKIRKLATPKVDYSKIGQWVTNLDSNRYALREIATAQLLKTGQAAIVPLQKVVEKNKSLEATRRAQKILAQLSDPPTTDEHFRAMEGLELMEILSSSDVLRFLEDLAENALDSIIREDARRALVRLRKKAGAS